MAEILGTQLQAYVLRSAAPQGRSRNVLAETRPAVKRGRSPTARASVNSPHKRAGKFDAKSPLRGLLHGRESAGAPKHVEPKGSELQWATQMSEKYRLGKVIGTGVHLHVFCCSARHALCLCDRLHQMICK